MARKKNRLPDLDQLFQAADAHAESTGEPDHAVGDLQEMLRAAWRIMTSAQHAEFFATPEMLDLADLPEYELLLDWPREPR